MRPRFIIASTAEGCSRPVAVAVLLVLSALLSACGGNKRASVPATTATHGARSVVDASVPATTATHSASPVVVGCQNAVVGDLGSGWRGPRRGTVIVGPIAWPELRVWSKAPPSSFASSHGLAPAVKALAVVNPGADVTVSVPAGEHDRLSLDYTYNIQPRKQTGDAIFRVSDGATAVTFAPCSGTQTQFAGGFIVSGARCAALDIQVAGNPTPVRRYVAFGVPQRNCHSASSRPPASPGGHAVATPGRGCRSEVHDAVLPVWARVGFSERRPRMPYVLGTSGRIAALLFGPLNSPPAADHNNKILWVSRIATHYGHDLRVEAQRMAGTKLLGAPVPRTVTGGPGPSIINLPSPGCWRLSLQWSGWTDTLDLTYNSPG